jgi:hypothetical protein
MTVSDPRTVCFRIFSIRTDRCFASAEAGTAVIKASASSAPVDRVVDRNTVRRSGRGLSVARRRAGMKTSNRAAITTREPPVCAYGVSCRARAQSALRRALTAIRPTAGMAKWFPRSHRAGLGGIRLVEFGGTLTRPHGLCTPTLLFAGITFDRATVRSASAPRIGTRKATPTRPEDASRSWQTPRSGFRLRGLWRRYEGPSPTAAICR